MVQNLDESIPFAPVLQVLNDLQVLLCRFIEPEEIRIPIDRDAPDVWEKALSGF